METHKKLSRRERDKQAPIAKLKPGIPVKKHKTGNLIQVFSLVIIVFTFLLYAQTLGFDYTHDDFSVIKENTIVSQGSKAIPLILKTSYRQGYNVIDGLYRPLSLVMFALEWSFSPDSPRLNHAINLLLFVFTAFILFKLLVQWFPGVSVIVPVCITLLFVSHPVHTEVVASIKSRDEILCFMLSILSLLFLMVYCKSRDIKRLLGSLICFFLALMSKETGVVLLVLIPVTLFYFSSVSLRLTIKTSAFFLIPMMLYFVIRFRVLHSLPSGPPVSHLDNFLVAAPDYLTRLASCFNILAEYLRLLVLPDKLISDYTAGTVSLVDWKNIVPAVSLLIHLTLFIYAVIKFKSKDPLVYGIIYYLVSIFLFSNILFVIGTPMGERLLYFPSLGYCIALAVLLKKITSTTIEQSPEAEFKDVVSNNRIFIMTAGIIITLYSVKTVMRSGDWMNNQILYSKDVITAPDDYRLRYYLGRELTRTNFDASVDSVALRAKFVQGIAELQESVKQNPDFADGYNQMGVAYTRLGEYKNAELAYLESLNKNPTNVITLNNLGSCYGMQNKLDEALVMFQRSFDVDQRNYLTLMNLANTYEYKGDQLSAKIYREKAGVVSQAE